MEVTLLEGLRSGFAFILTTLGLLYLGKKSGTNKVFNNFSRWFQTVIIIIVVTIYAWVNIDIFTQRIV